MNSKMIWAGRILSVLLSAFFLFNVCVKLFPETFYPAMIEQMTGIGLPESILSTIAILELVCAVLYLIPRTAALGAFANPKRNLI